MRFIGRLGYRFSLPLLRMFLSKTQRSYVLIRFDDEFLLSKNWLSNQKWSLPGGGIKKSESAKSAACRELHEELGIIIKKDNLQPLTEGKWQTDGLGHRYSIFLAAFEDKPVIKLSKPELIEAAWLSASDLNIDSCPAEILEAIRKIDKGSLASQI